MNRIGDDVYQMDLFTSSYALPCHSFGPLAIETPLNIPCAL